MTNSQIDIFQQKDGFYVGRMLKNGKMAKGAYKLTGEDIMTMYAQFFADFCKESGQQQMLMKTGDGQLLVTMKVPAKEAGEAKEKAADERGA